MTSQYSLSHSERLRRRGTIRRLFESGRSGFVYPLRYMWYAEPLTEGEATSAQVLFTVPKRLHKRANRRNLLRRRVKEAYRLHKSIVVESPRGAFSIDLALIYSTKEAHSYKSIDNAVAKILRTIEQAL